MATMHPTRYKKMILVGAMGIQPTQGEIMDQFLIYTTDYIKAGYYNESKYEECYGTEPDIDQLEQWEIHREMTTRIAWKPYMFNQGLAPLLGGVETPTLVVWGIEDQIVPLNCGEQYVQALPNAKLTILEECGHFADVEKADELATLTKEFIASE